MLRDYPKIMSFITAIERQIPTQSLCYKGLRVWPLIRQEITGNLLWEKMGSAEQNLATYMAFSENKMEASHENLALLKELENHRILRDASTRKRFNISEKRAVMFLTVGFEYTQLSNRKCNMFFDPLKEVATETGISWLEIIASTPVTDIVPEIQILSGDILGVSHNIAELQARTAHCQIENYKTLLDIVSQKEEIPQLNYPKLLFRAELILEYSRMFQAALETVKPELGVVVVYYNDLGMAFLHACSIKGVTSVELQHSFINQDDWNWAQWTDVPEIGYDVLPDRFWSWGEPYAAITNQWQKEGKSSIVPVIGGNLWISYWQTLGEKSSIPWQRNNDMNERVILYTVPFDDMRNFNGMFPACLVEAINASPDNYRWIIRFHDKTDKALFENIVSALAELIPRIDRLWLHVATECQLYALFAHVDLLVNQTSTTAIEAELFGIRNIIIGEHGRRWYSDSIENNYFLFAATAIELLEGIAGVRMPTVRPSPLIHTDRETANAALNELLA
jgi:hypothetical protein